MLCVVVWSLVSHFSWISRTEHCHLLVVSMYHAGSSIVHAGFDTQIQYFNKKISIFSACEAEVFVKTFDKYVLLSDWYQTECVVGGNV